jgi:hypothetical protein
MVCTRARRARIATPAQSNSDVERLRLTARKPLAEVSVAETSLPKRRDRRAEAFPAIVAPVASLALPHRSSSDVGPDEGWLRVAVTVIVGRSGRFTARGRADQPREDVDHGHSET